MKYRVPHLAIRMVRERTHSIAREKLKHSSDAAEIARAIIGCAPVEHLIAIVRDAGGNVTAVTTLAQGGMSACSTNMQDILRAVLACHGAAFVLAHNHPSGDPSPSADDIRFTKMVAEAAKLIGMPMLDHVVVTMSGDWRSIPCPE